MMWKFKYQQFFNGKTQLKRKKFNSSTIDPKKKNSTI